ncbi:hypothetical protein ACFQWF_21050 [Methylorubrum suomiense]
MLEPLSLAWGSLHRTEAQWRTVGLWTPEIPGVNAPARAVLHDALTLYLHALCYAAATPVLVDTLWAYARAGGELAPAFVLRASGTALLDEGATTRCRRLSPSTTRRTRLASPRSTPRRSCGRRTRRPCRRARRTPRRWMTTVRA